MWMEGVAACRIVWARFFFLGFSVKGCRTKCRCVGCRLAYGRCIPLRLLSCTCLMSHTCALYMPPHNQTRVLQCVPYRFLLIDWLHAPHLAGAARA